MFLSPTRDIVFKSMWLKGNKYVLKYLERLVEYAIGTKIPDYKFGPNETGIISYKQIANKVDILLISLDNEIKINVEMNRLDPHGGKNNIFAIYNKGLVYVGNYINSFYNDLKINDRYKKEIKVEQVNFNTFFCEQNELIHELHFELVDKNYDVLKEGIKIHHLYLPRLIQLCYDMGNDIYKDFLLLMSESYEDMERVASGNKEREEVVKFLKKLGREDDFMSVIDLEEYKDIQHQITLDYQKELATEEGHKQGVEQGIEKGIEQNKKESAINLYNNGVSKEIICKSLKLTEEQLEEYLN